MSDRKRERTNKTCSMCGLPAVIMQHGKCHNCRILLQMRRYATAGDLSKFRRKKGK